MDLWLCIVLIFNAAVVGFVLGWLGVHGIADKVNYFICSVKMFLVQKWLQDCGYTVRINEAEAKENKF